MPSAGVVKPVDVLEDGSLAYLAREIATASLDGAQPAALTSRDLLKFPALPLGWTEQRKLLGFA